MKKTISILLFVLIMLVLVSCGNLSGEKKDNETAQKQTYKMGEIQETQYGNIKGYTNTDENVLAWKAVPYAKAPTGDLRWKKPHELEKFEGTFDASKKDSQAFIQTGADGVIGSEDNLNLDIYRPNTEKKDLPVMVYLHGGNNQGGTSAELSGEAFVKDLETVFVSVNYRLGPLGFNPLPALNTGDDLEDSGNYAMLDMAASLDWVKDNIEAFGGDKDNITLSGFSAGGRDVMATLASPLFKDKYQKAIAFSGGMTTANEEESIKVFAKAIAPLVVEDKVKNTEDEAYQWLQTSGKDVRDYLYQLPAKRLSGLMGDAAIRMSAFPHLYTDGTVLPKNGFDDANYSDVPLMMFTGASEFSFFAMGDPYFAASIGDGTIPSDASKLAEFNFAKKYGSDFYRLFNTQKSAEKMADQYSAPIYNTEMQFGTHLTKTDDMDLAGAFHGVFIPLLDTNNESYLGTMSESYGLKGAQQLKELFRGYLKNFLHEGNPNGAGLTTWSAWKKDNQASLVLDANEVDAKATMTKETKTNQTIIDAIKKDQTIPENAKNTIIHDVLNGRWFSSELDAYFNNKSLWVK
ncbi:carboxylesterase family protein [Listeria sp. FSL L7-1582]|uniref:carboxylesterase family protein n=1 Tax=Listeria portnoyi TaxID=2713504 RepID=UPI00164DC4E4|nr:carboxylesterase family protein [Listeria portnoyi]MBC6310567.1 carboxylesterase family protein [Listeria portnoyi]